MKKNSYEHPKKELSKLKKIEWLKHHFAWTLIETKHGNLKYEEIPINGKSDIHFHQNSIQFFFITQGRAKFILDKEKHILNETDGIEVPPRKLHQVINIGNNKLLFLLASFPSVKDSDIFPL